MLNMEYATKIEGAVDIGQLQLTKCDGVGITEEDGFDVRVSIKSEVLCMEVPLI